jgi:hypothetical protein
LLVGIACHYCALSTVDVVFRVSSGFCVEFGIGLKFFFGVVFVEEGGLGLVLAVAEVRMRCQLVRFENASKCSTARTNIDSPSTIIAVVGHPLSIKQRLSLE